MIRKASLLVVGTLLFCDAGSTQAQASDPMPAGTRLRVTLGSGHRVTGRVLAVDDEVLTLLAGDQRLKLSRAEITAAEMSIGRRSAWLKGLVIGTGIGLASGLALPLDANCSSDHNAPDYDTGCVDSRGEAVGWGVVGGAGIGVLIGALVKHDVWAPTRLDRVRVGLVPKRGGGALQGSVVF